MLHRSKLTKFRSSVTTIMGTTAKTDFIKSKTSLKEIDEFKTNDIDEGKNNE